ncbi:MAG: signal peptide peptidase SppA [Bacteroidales bacterium]|nr:signal peptide peptidase SppA [Candidatus Colimorpha merdihippi]
METNNNKTNLKEPLGFGKTMLASAVGVAIAFVALNVIGFIMGIAFLAAAMSSASGSSTPITGDHIAIEMDLTVPIYERTPSEFMTIVGSSKGTSIEQLLLGIEHAAADSRIEALYLHLGGSGLDWAQAEELQEALMRFRQQSDKPIIAYGESMSQPEYFLATSADKIAVHPSGMIDFRGIGAEVVFYKGLLDKLGVHMELIRPTSCAYKSAGETYVRTDMSDANREQVRSYINSTWNYALQVMSQNRNISPQQLNHIADNLLGSLPDEALKSHLVDTLCFEQDIKSMLKNSHGVQRIVKANRYAQSISSNTHPNRIALIYAEGNVVDGTGNGSVAVYGDDIVEALNAAAKDAKVKAIVMRVNSPGGAVTASESMTKAVIEAKKKKPVIVSMSGLAASAGYEISCFATKIVAHPTTLTGSIGVFATIPEISNLLRQKLGVTTDTVMTNKNSTGLSLYRPLTPDARAMLQKNVEDFYITFTQRVADGRHLSRTYVDSIARGRVWTGIQAKQIGLVDTLGGLPLAFRIAAEEAQVDFDECSIKVFPAEKSLWEEIMEQVSDEQDEKILAKINAIIPFYSDLVSWSQMEPIQARLPFAIKLY